MFRANRLFAPAFCAVVAVSSAAHAQTSVSTAFGKADATAPIETVDFEGLPAGTVASILESDAGSEVGFFGLNPSLGGANAALIFNSADPSGGDDDLGTPNEDFGGPGVGDGGSSGSPFANDEPLGNLLIVGADLDDDDGDGLIDDPDDADDDGLIVIDFTQVAPVVMESLTIVDVDDDRDQPTARFFNANGALVGSINLPAVGDNGVGVVDLRGIAGVTRGEIDLQGSGAIDNLRFRQDCRAAIAPVVVWNDMNLDGVNDPAEPGIEGVRVRLFDEAGDQVMVQRTDRQGRVILRPLCAGTYTIDIDANTLPSGFFASPCDVGQDDTIDNDCVPLEVELPTNTTVVSDVGFGFSPPCEGSIGDFLWIDWNENGLQDALEPGLEGVTIRLFDTLGTELQAVTTGPGGFYTFMGLCPDTYMVTVDEGTLPGDFVQSLCDVGQDDTIDNDCSPAVVELGLNELNADVDFGYQTIHEGIIGNLIWVDLECDGLQVDGEALIPDPGGDFGLDGAGVILMDRMGVILQATTSDGEGSYQFAGLPDGEYRVMVREDALSEGLVPAPCNVGPDDMMDNDCSPTDVSLGSEGIDMSIDLTVDFGYITDNCAPAGEGCSDEFWAFFPDLWPEEYDPNAAFSSVFDDAFPGESLHDVLLHPGRGLDRLGRKTVAALLNAAANDVGFPITDEQVIDLFNDVFPGTVAEYEALGDFFVDLNSEFCPFVTGGGGR